MARQPELTEEAVSEVRISADVLIRDLDGSSVMLDLRSGKYFALNGTASRIFELFKAGTTIADTATTIATEFDVDLETATTDVAAFVEDIRVRGLTDPNPASDA